MEAKQGKREWLIAPILPAGVTFLLVLWAIGLWGFFNAPAGATFPVHWGIDGKPDRFGGPLETYLLTPAIGLILFVVGCVLPELAKGDSAENLRRSAGAWRTSFLATIALLVLVQTVISASAANSQLPVAQIITAAVGFLFVCLGNVLPKTRPNPWIGVRTPWTLRSEVSWTRTHRAAGYCYSGVGLGSVVFSFILPIEATSLFLFGGLMASTIWLVLYSRWTCLEAERAGT